VTLSGNSALPDKPAVAPVRETWRPSLAAPRWSWAIPAAIVLYPALYYVGWCDPYMAHCLYSANVPSAQIEHADGSIDYVGYLDELAVPLPPTHRHFDAYFATTAELGDVMEVNDPRWWAKQSGFSRRVVVAVPP
jgi:hypothetical protein